MKKSNFALRLQPSLLEEARRAASEEGVALNQLINVAVAEKLAAIRTESFFRARASRGNPAKTLEILNQLGEGNAALDGDELPENEDAARDEESKLQARAARGSIETLQRVLSKVRAVPPEPADRL